MNGNGVWKWIAITLVAFMLGGLPGYLYQYLHAPSKEEVSIIREQQQLMQETLIRMEADIEHLQEEVSSLKEGK